MNETLHSHTASDVPWPTSPQRVLPVADTSVLEGGSSPAAQKLADGVADAEEALHDKADELRATGDAWVQSVRKTVRNNPLACLAAALAAGAVIARLTRASRDTRHAPDEH